MKDKKECFGEWKQKCRVTVPEDLDCDHSKECKEKYNENRGGFL